MSQVALPSLSLSCPQVALPSVSLFFAYHCKNWMCWGYLPDASPECAHNCCRLLHSRCVGSDCPSWQSLRTVVIQIHSHWLKKIIWARCGELSYTYIHSAHDAIFPHCTSVHEATLAQETRLGGQKGSTVGINTTGTWKQWRKGAQLARWRLINGMLCDCHQWEVLSVQSD